MNIFLTFFILLFVSNLSFSQQNSILRSSSFSEIEKKMFVANEQLTDSIPPDFPLIRVDSINNPAPGKIFMTTFSIIPENPSYIMVLDSLAKPIYYKKVPGGGIDFKMAPNGQFSYASAIAIGDVHNLGPLTVTNAKVINYIMDSKFNIIDSVQCKNGHLADTHDFRILPNGNFLMLAYETIPVDMSKYLHGGNPNANVVGTVIQELDANKKCIFQWRSLDHIPLTQTRDNQLNSIFEHVHGNAYHLDTDGNLLVSFATTCEIVKINMISGKVMWRMGGFYSDFKIEGDNNDFYKPLYFTMQHDVKRLDNGNMLFFDNGYKKNPLYSRAVEYAIDEANKKATLVWEYRRKPDISGFAMGSAQRLANGNTLIDWGMVLINEFRTLTEVTPDKKIAYELSLPGDMYSYRALKYELPACQPIANVMVGEAIQGNTYKFADKKSNTGAEIFYKKLNAFMYNYVTLKKFDCAPMYPLFEGETPVVLPLRYTINTKVVYSFEGEMRFDLKQLPQRYQYKDIKLFFRKTEGKGAFKMLNTYLDSNENKLVAAVSDSGEYVLGFYRVNERINAPTLYSPYDNALLLNQSKIDLQFSPTGRYDKFNLQVAEDESFSKIVQNLSDLTETNLPLVLEDNKTYYWRVKTQFKEFISDWSKVWKFNLSSPLLEIQKPNGLDTLYNDSTTVIRWNTNLKDSLQIALYKNSSNTLLIKDTLYSVTNAYAWKVPKNQIEGNDYTIKIKSLKAGGISAETNKFVIKNRISAVDNQISTNEKLLNILTNPSNGIVRLNYNGASNRNIDVKIVDILGSVLFSTSNYYLNEGDNIIELNLSSLQDGVYFCIVNSNNFIVSEKIIILK